MIKDEHTTNDVEWQIKIWTIFGGLFVIFTLLVLDIFSDYKKWYAMPHILAEILSVIILFLLMSYLFILLIKSRIETKKWAEKAGHAADEAKKWKEETKGLLKGLGDLIDKQFDKWGLTEAEKEIGLFMLKGLSFKEIADIRSVSERTVRQQATTIYKKSKINSRSEFSAFFLEDLLLPNSLK